MSESVYLWFSFSFALPLCALSIPPTPSSSSSSSYYCCYYYCCCYYYHCCYYYYLCYYYYYYCVITLFLFLFLYSIILIIYTLTDNNLFRSLQVALWSVTALWLTHSILSFMRLYHSHSEHISGPCLPREKEHLLGHSSSSSGSSGSDRGSPSQPLSTAPSIIFV